MGKRATKPIRWSLNQAATEFGWARQTIKTRLAAAGISPAEGDTYSTAQLLAALFGDEDGQRLRKLTAEADSAVLAAQEDDDRLLPTAVVTAVWQDALGRMKDVIMSAPMPDDSRAGILKSFQDLPLREYTEAKARAGEADSTG